MDNNTKTLSEFFKRTIFDGLEKVDASNFDQRNNVYDAALKSLDSVHARSTRLSDVVKSEQRQVLHQLISEIENKITEINYQESIDDFQEQNDLLADEMDINKDKKESSSHSFFSSIFLSSKSVIKDNRKPMLLLLCSALLIAICSVFYINLFDQRDASSNLTLPYVLKADENLLEFGKAKKRGSASFSGGDEAGILYEVDSSGTDNSNMLDFLIRGKLGEEINAIDQSILVTFHIKKISKGDIILNLLYRDAGRIIRKSVEIRDQNTNEYFLITSAEKNNKDRKATLIRLEVALTSEKFEEKPVILLKKVVLSEI